MARVVKPGGRVVVLEITTPTKPPLSTFFSIWFDRLVPLLGRFDEAYTYLPKSVKRFPGPEALGGVLARAGLDGRALDPHRRRDHRPALRDGAPDGVRRGRRRGHRGRRRARAGAARPARGAARRGRRLARRGARRARRRDDLGRRQAAAAAAGVRGRGLGEPMACCAPRSRSSSCTRPRWSTTTCSTPRQLRRGRPTVVAAAGRELATATGDLLFSRAFAELAANGRADEVRVLSDASSALAQGELMQRSDAWNVGDDARALPRALRPQDRAAVRGRVRARRARGRRPGRAAGAVRAPDRARVPAARRRARRLRPGGAHRQAPRHRPARRHGHAAADRRPRARSGARRAGPARRAHARAGGGGVRRDRRHGGAGGRAGGCARDGRGREGRSAGAAGCPARRARAGGRRRGRSLQPRSPSAR